MLIIVNHATNAGLAAPPGQVMIEGSPRPQRPLRIADLVRRFERGDFDLISIGRSLIGDPDWVAKMRDGRGAEIRPFRRTDLEWLS